MIVTLTANPSLDRTVALPGPLAPRRSTARHLRQPGIRAARESTSPAPSWPPGWRPSPSFPAPRPTPSSPACGKPTFPSRPCPIGEPLRSNVALTEPGGVTTKINEPGPVLSEDQQEALISLLLDRARGAALGCPGRLAPTRGSGRLLRHRHPAAAFPD